MKANKASRPRYEIWDYDSNNASGSYSTEAAAFRDIVQYVDEYGDEAAETLALVECRSNSPGETIKGALLVARARAAMKNSASAPSRAHRPRS